jgi:toxin ParE1/3/4
VPRYRFSGEAALDLNSITHYTLNQYDEVQARKYLVGLRSCVEQLARMPGMGRHCPEIEEGFQRFLYEKHWIYYITGDDSILVVRILHQSMNPRYQAFTIQ